MSVPRSVIPYHQMYHPAPPPHLYGNAPPPPGKRHQWLDAEVRSVVRLVVASILYESKLTR